MIALAFGLGLLGSVLGTLMVRAIAADPQTTATVTAAMTLELCVGLLGIWGWQLWAARRHDRRILVAELAGSVLGTGLALRFGW